MAESEASKTEAKRNPTAPGEKKKSSFGRKFLNFLMMGGFLLVLIVIIVLVIAISVAVQSC
jgi:hypothetical protein